MPEVRVVAHHVPQDRPVADGDHRLGQRARSAPAGAAPGRRRTGRPSPFAVPLRCPARGRGCPGQADDRALRRARRPALVTVSRGYHRRPRVRDTLTVTVGFAARRRYASLEGTGHRPRGPRTTGTCREGAIPSCARRSWPVGSAAGCPRRRSRSRSRWSRSAATRSSGTSSSTTPTTGYDDFVIALGYRGELIKQYFAQYAALAGRHHGARRGAGLGRSRPPRRSRTGRCTSSIPAYDTATGGRMRRVAHLLDDTFMMTFGDGVSDVDISRLVAFHKAHGRLATHHRGAPAGPLRPRRARGRCGRRVLGEAADRRGLDQRRLHGPRAGSVLDYIDDDDDLLPDGADGAPRRRRPADGVSPRLVLAVHGHDARSSPAREPVGVGTRALEGLGLMRVLVTGSEGYIGTVLCAYLLDRGHDVTGLDTGFHRVGWLYHGVDRSPTWIAKDIRHVTVEDLRGYDAVVHLAELSNDPVGQLNPDITFEINHHGSVRLATLAREAGVERFVYMSSCSVYGAAGDTDSTETSDVDPLTAYAKCKVLVERDVPADGRRRLLADVPAQRDGLRRLARGCASTSSSTTSPATPGPSRSSAWTATARRGDRSSTSSTSARRSICVLRAPRDVVHGADLQRRQQRSRTTRSARSPRSSPTRSPAAARSSATAPATTATTARTSTRSASACRFETRYDVARGAQQLLDGLPRDRHDDRAVRVARPHPDQADPAPAGDGPDRRAVLLGRSAGAAADVADAAAARPA